MQHLLGHICTVKDLKTEDLPDDLTHEEVVSLKDLDATLLEVTTDD